MGEDIFESLKIDDFPKCEYIEEGVWQDIGNSLLDKISAIFKWISKMATRLLNFILKMLGVKREIKTAFTLARELGMIKHENEWVDDMSIQYKDDQSFEIYIGSFHLDHFLGEEDSYKTMHDVKNPEEYLNVHATLKTFFDRPELWVEIIESLKEFKENENLTLLDNWWLVTKKNFFIGKNYLDAKEQNGFRISIKISALKEMQRYCNVLSDLISDIFKSDINLTENKLFKKKIVDIFNDIQSVMYNVQRGLNYLFARFNKMYQFSVKYAWKWAKNQEMMAQFLNAAIQSGMPSKYIAYNAFLIAGDEIRGETKEYEDAIITPSRIIFFHSPKEIYKLAINGLGKFLNNTEEKVTNDLKDSSTNVIAKVLGSWGSGVMISMERADEVKSLSREEIDKLLNNFNELVKQRGKKYRLKDITERNLGYINKNLVLSDYSNLINTL